MLNTVYALTHLALPPRLDINPEGATRLVREPRDRFAMARPPSECIRCENAASNKPRTVVQYPDARTG